MNDIIKPKFRYRLKGEIISTGFKTLTEFSKAVDRDLTTISRIVSGWEIPGQDLQRNMAQVLGISLRELRGLLESG